MNHESPVMKAREELTEDGEGFPVMLNVVLPSFKIG